MAIITITHTTNNVTETVYFRKGKPFTKRLSLATKVQDRTLDKALASIKDIIQEDIQTDATITVMANDAVTVVKEHKFHYKATVKAADGKPEAPKGRVNHSITLRQNKIERLQAFKSRMIAKADRCKASMERSTSRAAKAQESIDAYTMEISALLNPAPAEKTPEVVQAAVQTQEAVTA